MGVFKPLYLIPLKGDLPGAVGADILYRGGIVDPPALYENGLEQLLCPEVDKGTLFLGGVGVKKL